jgi:GT2 family glycosyltransferase
LAEQEPKQEARVAEETKVEAETHAAALEAQPASRDAWVREQAEKLAQLEQELNQARSRDVESALKIELLEREKDEILAVLESINRSVAWRLVKRYRRARDRLLPPGTLGRRLYDRLLTRFKSSEPSSAFRSAVVPIGERHGVNIAATAGNSCRTQLVILNVPRVFEAGKAEPATVEITNLSAYTWEAMRKDSGRRGIVRLSYHWYDEAGKVVQWDGERTNLPHDLGPQDSVTVDMLVLAPFDPGTYTLEITLVREGIAWSDERGSAGARVSVQVEPSRIRAQEFPSCSIIIPAFNRTAFTRACLLAIERSVPAEQCPHEVIVVDNGSTDETPQVLSAWSRSRANARVASVGQNLGFARACNEGARLARGHYLLFMNNDTLPTPGWLQKMLRLAESEAQVGIVGSKLLFPNGRIQHIGVVFDQNKNPRHIYRGLSSDIPPAKTSREYQAATGACLLVARDLYQVVGGMDEGYENSYEDVDLCMKVRARGYRVLVCADSVVYHFESMSEGRRASDFRNQALFKARWGNDVQSDADRWYSLDKRRGDEWTELDEPEAYSPRQESLLQDLWRRVYLCELSRCEFSSRRSETESALDAHFGDHS